MWLRASTKLATAASAIVCRACGGAARVTASTWPPVTAAATWAVWAAAGVPASRSATPLATWWLKIEPSAAMPVAIPTCRKVELTPEAMPERSGVTTPTAVEASGTLIRPMPRPATTRPGIRWVQPSVGVMPMSSSSPTPSTAKPGAISHFVGTWLVSRPAAVAATNEAAERNRNRRPAWTAE